MVRDPHDLGSSHTRVIRDDSNFKFHYYDYDDHLWQLERKCDNRNYKYMKKYLVQIERGKKLQK